MKYMGLWGMRDKEELAIQDIYEYQPKKSIYWVAFSGGKDSIVVLDLVRRSGVPYEVHYSMTTVDPPEVYKFIRENYPDVIWERPKRSMFQLIVRKGMLPTRMIRFCCSNLKEVGGKGRLVVTGIRREESRDRRTRQLYEQSTALKSKWFLNPIIDWSTEEVWRYIKKYKMPYCELYDKGYERLGCIMCPAQSTKGMLLDKARYPKYYKAYLRAIQHSLDRGTWKGPKKTAEEIMYWWIYGKWEE